MNAGEAVSLAVALIAFAFSCYVCFRVERAIRQCDRAIRSIRALRGNLTISERLNDPEVTKKAQSAVAANVRRIIDRIAEGRR